MIEREESVTRLKLSDFIPALVIIIGMCAFLTGSILWGHAVNANDEPTQWIFGCIGIMGLFMIVVPVWKLQSGELH